MWSTRRTLQERASESRCVAIAWRMPVEKGQSVSSLIFGVSYDARECMISRDGACAPLDTSVTMMFLVAMVAMVWKRRGGKKKMKKSKMKSKGHKWGRHTEW